MSPRLGVIVVAVVGELCHLRFCVQNRSRGLIPQLGAVCRPVA